jgi:zinc protease
MKIPPSVLLAFALVLPFTAPAPAAPPEVASPAAASPARAAPGSVAVPAGISRFTSVEGVTEYRLDNGLKLLLIPDPSTDTVMVNVTYLVGSRHEGYGETGMAHLLEHLVFRGTPKNPSIKGELQKRGARFNGTTSSDRTNYYETLSAGDANLEFALALEADRMLNANISKSDLDAEMTVVRNEYESGENSATNVLRQRVTAAAFDWHGYGRSTIGARSDIENVPVDRLRAFYRTYYQPDNAIVIVAGKFDEAKALALAKKHFGAIPKPKRVLPPTYTVEPTQDGERHVVLRRAGDTQAVTALYHMPPGTHPDYAAVDVLVQVLGHTPSGRLHKALVESGKATSAYGSERQLREAGYAYFGAGLRMDQSLDAARDALLATVEDIARNPITEEELEQARTRLVNDIEVTVADSGSLALVLTETAAMGDWRTLYLHRDRLKKVTLEDVQRVARQYLKPANRTTGVFIPTSSPDRAEIPAVPDLEAALRDYRGQTAVSQGEAFDPTPANIEARVQRKNLPGGMKLALLPRKTRGERVVADLALHWGDEQSKAGRSAACSLTSAMLQRGTRTKTRQQISNEFSRLRATVGVSASGASIETVRENLPAVMRLVAEVLREPSFPESEFAQLKQSGLAGLEAQRSDPGALSGIVLRRHIDPLPPAHWAYNPTLDERIERLKAVTLDEVRACYTDFLGASNSELAVVGDFEPAEVARLAEELFGDWKSPRPYQRIPARLAQVEPIDQAIRTPDKANATYRAAANLKLRDDDPDFPALVLANYLFGGSIDARLARRVREKEGLSYSVGSYLNASSLDEKGEFGISAIFAPQNRDRVDAAVADELRRMALEGFSPEEVEAGKKSWLQARQIARNRDTAIASRLGLYLEIGRTYNWDAELEKRVTALSAKDVSDTVRRRLDGVKLSVVKAGDFKAGAAATPAAAPAPSAGG